MKKNAFYFDLPDTLIAQYPLENRSDSRLLAYNRATGAHEHRQFNELVDLLEPGDLLVMNDSRVIPARLYGRKASGGKLELLIERMLDQNDFLAHIKSSKSPKPGSVIILDEGWELDVLGRMDDLFHCKVRGDLDTMLAQIGHIPLPPYITRGDESDDHARYQTVYAKYNGSVAAPTAGLHFDESVLKQLTEKGIHIAFSTLHVGAGTFRPVRCENIADHKMHAERYTVSETLCEAVHDAKARGGRVIAVGTTAMRCLESAASNGQLQAGSGETDIFISPGYSFKLCDGMVTNFHLPESTLLMLVSALIGHQNAMDLYQLAIDNQYRFFSYGDACLLL